LRSPRALGSSNILSAASVPTHNFRLPRLGRHLSVFHPNLPLSQIATAVDLSDFSQAPRLSSRSLQHVRMNVPFFSLSLMRKRSKWNARHSESPVPRVWLPSLRCQLPSPLEVSLNSQRSWDSPFKAFFLLRDRKILSNLSLRPCASLQNPLRPRTDAPTASSHEKSCAPLLQPNGLDRVGAYCSPGLYDLSGSQIPWPTSKASPFQRRPLALPRINTSRYLPP
jgi:hypothetical protein